MLLSFASCGDSQESSSELSSSVSESATAPETTTEEATTLKTTETITTKATQSTTVVFDYETYENDYYTMNISPEWDTWSVGIRRWFDISSNLKLELWGGPTDLRYNNNKDFAEYWVNDANNDSRISYTSEVCVFGENYFAKSPSGDDCISYVCQNGEDVNFFNFYFIDSLDENEEKIISDILTSVKLKNMNESDKNETITSEVKNKKFTFEDLSFELPENCEEEKETDNVLYTFEDFSFISIIKSPGASQFDLYNSDDSLKQLAFEVTLSSMIESSDAEKKGEAEKTSVNGEFALKQAAKMYGFSDVSFYVFLYGDNMYTIGFATMGKDKTQAYDIQDEIIKSISFNGNPRITDEKTNEPQAIESTNSFEPFTISGTGSTVIKDVNIPAEFVVYNATYNGEHNFVVSFYDCNDRSKLLINEIGNYNCTQIFDATNMDDSSSGMIEVDAAGDWNITFSPVKSVVNNKISTSFSGHGADITGAFKSTGNMVCTVSHNGTSNFIVYAYELIEDGDREYVVNEIGEYNGQSVMKLKKDTLYFFNVEADGNWTIEVE
ncbi:MAG: hypothetical protein K2H19_05055 [Ruminococcus sp.]|nr:hypothetical protein [Ruminococcus sp.]